MDSYQRRSAISLAREITQLAASGAKTEDIAAAADRLKGLSADEGEDAEDVMAAGERSLASLDRIRNDGIDLGFGVHDLDEVLGGLRRGNLYILGAKTSQGKTTTAINIARHNLETNKKCKVLYNVFENAEQIPTRLASQVSNIPLDYYLKPHTLDEGEYETLQKSVVDLAIFGDRLRIVQNAGLQRLRAVCKKTKPDIVIVDYLQRWAHRDNMGSNDRLSHAVGKAVSDLQDVALEFNTATICLSQLSRRTEDQRNRPPVIEDLKESGDIENYADVILLLYWPWRDTLSPKYDARKYNFLVRKNKMGPCIDIPCEINLKTLKLKDWQEVMPSSSTLSSGL